MTKMDQLWTSPTATIKETLQIIDQGTQKTAFVVDDQKKLLGIITDGDVRRGLLKGCTLDDPSSKIMNTQFTSATLGTSDEKLEQLARERSILHIPILDAEGLVLDVFTVGKTPELHRDNPVVLMVGGLGTRLRPLTNTTPKPLLQVGDRPILETIIANFAKYGFRNFQLCGRYRLEKIEEYFGDGQKFGVHINYVKEDKELGTAGALSLVKEHLNKPFFVMNGDILTNINCDQFMNFHLQGDQAVSIAVKEHRMTVPYGVAEISEGKVLGISEKPTSSFYINAGVYILNPNSLDLVPENEYFDMTSLISASLSHQQSVRAFPIREYWLDIGQHEDYARANTEFYEVFGGSKK